MQYQIYIFIVYNMKKKSNIEKGKEEKTKCCLLATKRGCISFFNLNGFLPFRLLSRWIYCLPHVNGIDVFWYYFWFVLVMKKLCFQHSDAGDPVKAAFLLFWFYFFKYLQNTHSFFLPHFCAVHINNIIFVRINFHGYYTSHRMV